MFLIELFFLMTPAYFGTISIISMVVRYFKCIWIVAELFRFMIRKPFCRRTAPIILLSCYSVLLPLISFLRHSDRMNDSITKMIGIILAALVMYRKSRENFGLYSKVFRMYGLGVITLNLLTYILFPNGLYHQVLHGGGLLGGNEGYLLGVDNGFGAFILPFLMLIGYLSYLEKNRVDIWMLAAMSVSAVTYICTRSMTGFLAVAAYIGLFYASSLRKTAKLVNYKLLLVLFLFMTWFIVIFGGVRGMDNSLTDFIVNDLEKDLTFSGRTKIWAKALVMIKSHPILGYGAVKDGAYVQGIASKFGAHNTLLQILLESGLFSLVFFFAALMTVIVHVNSTARTDRLRALFHIGVFATWVYYTFESANTIPLWAVCIFISTASKKENQLECLNGLSG